MIVLLLGGGLSGGKCRGSWTAGSSVSTISGTPLFRPLDHSVDHGFLVLEQHFHPPLSVGLQHHLVSSIW
jgi:hypothetical protein